MQRWGEKSPEAEACSRRKDGIKTSAAADLADLHIVEMMVIGKAIGRSKGDVRSRFVIHPSTFG